MKKFLFFAAALCFTATGYGQQTFQPGGGVANEHGEHARTHDVAFIPRSSETGYGYRDVTTVVGLTVLPWSVPNHESRVQGVRLNLGWGSYRESVGFDTGLFSASGYAAGLQINAFGNLSTGDSDGLHIGGLVNIVDGHQRGVQISLLVNSARQMDGLQIGLVNYTRELCGVQIGLLNFATSQWSVPLINIAF